MAIALVWETYADTLKLAPFFLVCLYILDIKCSFSASFLHICSLFDSYSDYGAKRASNAHICLLFHPFQGIADTKET
jgi:hypothetical protein